MAQVTQLSATATPGKVQSFVAKEALNNQATFVCMRNGSVKTGTSAATIKAGTATASLKC